MYAIRFFVLRIKDLFLSAIICLFIFCLILFSTTNIEAAKSGLLLWTKSILPSLLPFFIAVDLLSATNTVHYLGKIFHKIMRPLFNVPGEGFFPLLMGLLTGYPVGAKIIVKLKEQGVCNNIECERLLSFTNNSNPLFIVGTVGVIMFHSHKLGTLLLISHLISCIIVGFCFRWWKKNEEKKLYPNVRTSNLQNSISFSNLGYILGKSITTSINTVLLIGGFVVLFSVICSILDNSGILMFLSLSLNPVFGILGISYNYLHAILIGFIELTNGLNVLRTLHFSVMSIYITSFLLGFGGLSIFLQVFSIVSPANISIKPYLLGKLLQAIFSVIIITIMI